MIEKTNRTGFCRRRLPHWEVENGRYFITICQYGAIPSEAAEKIRSLRHDMDQLAGGDLFERERAIIREMELWLDRTESKGDLTHPSIAQMIIEAIAHRISTGEWDVYSYVIMKNHVHLFLKINNRGLFDSIEQFKRWTGGQGNRILGAKTKFWAREWFDHWSRSTAEDEKIINYIRQNPVKAGLRQNDSEWPYLK